MLVDSGLHRLIVSHTGSDTVDFVDTNTGALERQIYVGATHGIAIDETKLRKKLVEAMAQAVADIEAGR